MPIFGFINNIGAGHNIESAHHQSQLSNLSQQHQIETNNQGVAKACGRKNFFQRMGDNILMNATKLHERIVDNGDPQSIKKLTNDRVTKSTDNFNQRVSFMLNNLLAGEIKTGSEQFTMLRHLSNLIEYDSNIQSYDTLLTASLDKKLDSLNDNQLKQLEKNLLNYKKTDFSENKQHYLEDIRQCVSKHNIARSEAMSQQLDTLVTQLDENNKNNHTKFKAALNALKAECKNNNIDYESNLESIMRLSLQSLGALKSDLNTLNQHLSLAKAEVTTHYDNLENLHKNKLIDDTDYANRLSQIQDNFREIKLTHQAVHTELFTQQTRGITAEIKDNPALTEDTKQQINACIKALIGIVNTTQNKEEIGDIQFKVQQSLQRFFPANHIASKAALTELNKHMVNIANDLRSDPKTALGNKLQAFRAEISYISKAATAVVKAIRYEALSHQVGQFTDTQLTGTMSPLGKGAGHEVMLAHYGSKVKVYKADDDKLAGEKGGAFIGPLAIGIDHSSPRLLERGVVASRIDSHLKFNIVAKTDFAMHNDQLGIVMDKAKGTAGADIKLKAKDPHIAAQLQPQFIKMQLVDIITGQADRHMNNYLIHVDQANKVKLTAIDNDFCLGPDWENLNTNIRKKGNHLQKYPPVVDKTMYSEIKKMTHDDLTRLSDGLLSDDAVKAAQTRLTNLQQHLEQLQQDGKVIDASQWGTPQVSQWLDTPRELTKVTSWVKNGDFLLKNDDPKASVYESKSLYTSYLARDQQHFLAA